MIMRTLVALLLMTTCATAQDAVSTCTGRVAIETGNGELYPKGVKGLVIGDCFNVESRANEKRILRTCPIGSRCRVEGIEGGDSVLDTLISVTRVK